MTAERVCKLYSYCSIQKLCQEPKYRGIVLEWEVAEVAEEIIRETCKELDIEVIDMAVNVDHVHLFIKNPFRKAFTKLLRKV